MTGTTYEGWKNWETWNVVLWVDNEYAIYKDKIRFFGVVNNRNIRKGKLGPIESKKFCLRHFPDGTPDMRGDDNKARVGKAAMKKVDWDEVAAHWALEMKEYEHA